MSRIAIIAGDGIGPEVIREAVRVLELVSARRPDPLELTHWDLGADRYLRDGVTITEQEFRALADEHDAILLGALGDPRVPNNEHARDILLGLRFRLDLFVNYRPSRLLHPRLCPLHGSQRIDIDIFRENTDGVYVNMGGHFKKGTPDEVATEIDLNTRKGVERIVRYAFEHAARTGRRKVVMADKSNVLVHAHELWGRVFKAVAAEHPSIQATHLYVDNLALQLVRDPAQFEVVVTSNMFGDIVTDLAAGLQGGLGMAASGNIHPGRLSLFEPVHGSSPALAGRNVANPMGAILSAALMLDHVGWTEEARRMEDAVLWAVQNAHTTADIGGDKGTREVGEAIAARLRSGNGVRSAV